MKIYFAVKLHDAKKEDVAFYKRIIDAISSYGEVLTENFGELVDRESIHQDSSYDKADLESMKKKGKVVHDFDLDLISKSDLVIADVSWAALGVGYEIRYAIEKKKKVLCLVNKSLIDLKSVSKMILGAPNINIIEYRDLKDLEKSLRNYLTKQND